jgi:hypothetical protein
MSDPYLLNPLLQLCLPYVAALLVAFLWPGNSGPPDAGAAGTGSGDAAQITGTS